MSAGVVYASVVPPLPPDTGVRSPGVLHDATDDVYHWYVYGLVPVVGVVAVKVITWPLSIDAGDGLTVDATSAVLTVTFTAFECEVYPGMALSETTAQ